MLISIVSNIGTPFFCSEVGETRGVPVLLAFGELPFAFAFSFAMAFAATFWSVSYRLEVNSRMLYNQSFGYLVEVAHVADAGLYHRTLVLIEPCQVEKHVGAVSLAQDKFWVEFTQQFPTSLAPGNVLVHGLANLSAETARGLAVLSEQLFCLMRCHGENAELDSANESVYSTS